jgi:hypothetical protein
MQKINNLAGSAQPCSRPAKRDWPLVVRLSSRAQDCCHRRDRSAKKQKSGRKRDRSCISECGV